MYIADTLGERIRLQREKADLTQEQLAREIHQRRDTVAKWETGSRIPSINDVAALSKVLDVSTDYLILGRKFENQMVLSALGLSDSSIDSLCFFIEQNDRQAINFANGMLEDWDVFSSLAALVANAQAPPRPASVESAAANKAAMQQHMEDFKQAEYNKLLAYEHLRQLVDNIINGRRKPNGKKESR